MIVTGRSNRNRFSGASLQALNACGVRHDDVVGHGLDDVVQSAVLPMRDAAIGGVRSHLERRGLQDARHLHIGTPPLDVRRVAVARTGCGQQSPQRIVHDWLVHGVSLAFGRHFGTRGAIAANARVVANRSAFRRSIA
jgi:hypothetical protein